MYLLLRNCISLMLIVVALYSDLNAKTRWSTFHCIPDADLLLGGQILFDVNSYFAVGSQNGLSAKPSGILTLGIIEWVSITGGYAGGPTFGLKARILGETKDWMPSLALGVRNIFTHEESYWYDTVNEPMSNEVYCALGKGIENLRLRINIGVQSIPENELDMVNLFAGIEKYFGNGLYVSFEFFQRQKEYVMSLFADWRIFKRKVELYAGAVNIAGLFSGNGSDENSARFVKPGIRGGVRICLDMKKGKSEGFTTIEDRLIKQNQMIGVLKGEVDSLKSMLVRGNSQIEGINRSIKELTDSTATDDGRYRMIAMEKLATLKSLYEQEPFEPEQVKTALRELTVHRDNILSALLEISLNKKEDARLRTLAVAACGEIGTNTAADALIEILGQTHVPEMKIEALIALGKLKEVRATFLMQQLAGDPNDAVAFTASEVLQKLEKETGIPLLKPAKQTSALQSIPENKIGERFAGSSGLNEVIEETSQSGDTINTIQKIEKKEIVESSFKETTPVKSSGDEKLVSDTVLTKSSLKTAPPIIDSSNGSNSDPNNSTTSNNSTTVNVNTTVPDSTSKETIKQNSNSKDTTIVQNDSKKNKTKKVPKEKTVETGDW